MPAKSKQIEEEVHGTDNPDEEPITCDLCDDADALVAPFLSAIAEIRKELKRLQKPVSSLRIEALKLHLRCSKCNIFFGGTHFGGTLPIPESQGGMCQWCAKKYLRGKRV